MKRFYLFTITLAAITGLAYGVTLTAGAQEADVPPMDEAHVERIRAHCDTAQATLRQLNASDALMRVNRGQLYESVSTKLMANLNSRIALNRLEGAELIQITSNYERQLQSFRDAYQAYQEALAPLLRIDCSQQPVTFYDTVAEVRELRLTVRESVSELNADMAAYLEAFTEFEKAFLETNGADNE